MMMFNFLSEYNTVFVLMGTPGQLFPGDIRLGSVGLFSWSRRGSLMDLSWVSWGVAGPGRPQLAISVSSTKSLIFLHTSPELCSDGWARFSEACTWHGIISATSSWSK